MQLFCLHCSHISRNFSTVYQFEGAFRRFMRKCLLPFFIALIVITSPAWAVPFYTVTNLGTLEGYSSSQAYGINDSGQVTGSSSDFSQHIMHSRAFLYNPDTMAMTNLGTVAQPRLSLRPEHHVHG